MLEDIFKDFIGRDNGSSVGLVSNNVFLSDATPESITSLLTQGKLPHSLLASTIHEIMHWETFNTPVGNSLSALFLRAWKNTQILKGIKSGENISRNIVLDYSRFLFSTNLFRPLIEGMALFAEFDLGGGNSSLATRATIISGMFFDFDVPDGNEEFSTVGARSAWNLFHARQSEDFQVRKERLLQSTFKSDKGEYLHGYYLLKNLHINLIRKKGLTDLLDGDLFLHCIRSIFFGDINLARIILDEKLDFVFIDENETTCKDAFNEIGKRWQQLFSDVFIHLNQDYIDQIKKIIGSTAPWSWREIKPLSNHDIQTDDYSLLHNSLSDLLANTNRDVLDPQVIREISSIIENRDCLSIGSVPVRLIVSKNNRVSVKRTGASIADSDYPLAVFTPDTKLTADSYDGTFELYLKFDFDISKTQFFAVYRIDHQILHVLVPNGKDVTEIVGNTMSSQISRARYIQMRDEILNSSKTELWESLARPTLDQAHNYTQKVMIKYNSAICEELYQGDQNVMFSCSPFSNMENDIQFMSDFSALSLVSGGICERQKIRNYMTWLEIDEDVFMRKMAALSAKGAPFGRFEDDLVYLYL